MSGGEVPAALVVDEKGGAAAAPIRSVQLDGLVLLKIMKHCKENVSKVVTGSLLGCDFDGRLEVTHVYASPSGESEDSIANYQLEMMKHLRKVNVELNNVGWYQSAFLSNFLRRDIVDAQFDFQTRIPASVLVVHDVRRTTAGSLALKAYRLTDSFMKSYSKPAAAASDSKTPANKKAAAAVAGAADKDKQFETSVIFEEIPIKVHNSHLVHGFLYELREQKAMRCDFDRLALSTSSFLEKNLDMLGAFIEDFSTEQGKFSYHSRQVTRQRQGQAAYLTRLKEEREARAAAGKEPLPEPDLTQHPLFKPVPKPSHLDSFLVLNKLGLHCKQISSTAMLALNRLYVIDSIAGSGAGAAASAGGAAAAAGAAKQDK